MRTRTTHIASLILSLTIFGGCAAGRENVLFMTKSNIGIDVDSKPPTAELSIARREAVIAPTFVGGKTPTVAASFRSRVKGIIGLFYNVAGTFSGGDAAATMARWAGDGEVKEPKDIQSSTLCLPDRPSKSASGKAVEMPDSHDVRAFIFGTDTSLGLKVAWSGLTAQVPDTVRLGYNRKEMAWAPIFIKEETCEDKVDGVAVPGKFTAKVPSFLAIIDSTTKAMDPATSGGEYIQYFATGMAANYLTLRPEIRQTMLERLDPQAAEKVKSFRLYKANQTEQFESIQGLQKAYDTASPENKKTILSKAIELGLVPNDTTEETFKKKISRADQAEDPNVTAKLNSLKEFIQKLVPSH